MKLIVEFVEYGTRLNIVAKSKALNSLKRMIIPKANPISPTRLTIIAFMADLLAWIRVNQKLIKR